MLNEVENLRIQFLNNYFYSFNGMFDAFEIVDQRIDNNVTQSLHKLKITSIFLAF